MGKKLKKTVISGAPGGVDLDQEIQRHLTIARNMCGRKDWIQLSAQYGQRTGY